MPDRQSENEDSQPSQPKENPGDADESAQVIFEGGWGPAGSDVAGPPAASDDRASRIGSFPNDPEDTAPQIVRRKPADD